jgi:hemolysin activation/secretion protein
MTSLIAQTPIHEGIPFASLVLALLGYTGLAKADTAPRPTSEQFQQIEQLNQLLPRIPNPLPVNPKLDLRILTPEKSAIPKAVDDIEFTISGVNVDGATYFTQAEVDSLFTHLVNKNVGLSELREAANALERKYRERGFFLARVFVPPQKIKDGLFKIQVVEGFISQVFVDGENDAMNEEVATFARQLVSLRPLDLAGLERVLLIINDLPGISVTAVLRPGIDLGSSELLLTAKPLGNIYLGTFNNYGSQTAGPFSMGYNATLQQPFNSLGQLNIGMTASGKSSNNLEGIRSAVARYSQALGSSGLTLSLGGVLSESKPAGALEPLDLKSNSTSLAPRLRYPLLRSRASSVYLDTGLAVNNNVTTLAGAALSHDRYTVVDVLTSWVLNGWMNGTQSLGLGVAKGIHAFGSMNRTALQPTTAGFDSAFTKYALNVQRTQLMPSQFSVYISGNLQYSRDRLLGGERIAFGGSLIGRGFPAAIIAGDKGHGMTLELRRDLNFGGDRWIQKPQMYVSVDSAVIHTNPSPTIEGTRSHLSSKAIGTRFVIFKDTQLDLRLATANQNLVTDDSRRNRRLLMEAITRF